MALGRIQTTCNRDHFIKRMREASRMPIAQPLAKLRRHILKLAEDSLKRGRCKTAGIEISKAVRLAEKSPNDIVYWNQVKAARGGKLRGR